MIAVAGSVLLASLLGSPHCAGMCGGFVCFYAGQGGKSQALAHAAYNFGRLVSYLILGVIAGLLGRTLDQAGAGAGLHRTAAVAAGAVMVVWGTASLLTALGVKMPHSGSFGLLGGRFAAILRGVHDQHPVVRALAVGLFTTLLPCGWLWVYVATAAGTGSVTGALWVMGAFWLGTVPMMAGLGLAAQSAFGPLRRHLPILTAATLVVLGLATLGGRFHLSPIGARCTECERVESHVGR